MAVTNVIEELNNKSMIKESESDHKGKGACRCRSGWYQINNDFRKAG